MPKNGIRSTIVLPRKGPLPAFPQMSRRWREERRSLRRDPNGNDPARDLWSELRASCADGPSVTLTCAVTMRPTSPRARAR
jgi:hypothetical protein